MTTDTLTDTALVYQIASLKEELASLRDQLARAEFELQTRLEAKGATSIPNEHYDVKLEKTYLINVETLRANVKEHLTPEQWDRAVEEEHEVTTLMPAKANQTVLNSYRKFGDAVSQGIDAARILNGVKLSVKERK